jgi:antitoxin VapB
MLSTADRHIRIAEFVRTDDALHSPPRGATVTDAIISALENELRRNQEKIPLADRFESIARELGENAGPNDRAMTKQEIDEMWGH